MPNSPSRVQSGPKPTLPLTQIAKLTVVDGKPPREVAVLLGLSQEQVYQALYRIRSKEDFADTMGEIRRHVRARLMSKAMAAAESLAEVSDIDPMAVAPAAVSKARASEAILDRVGIGPDREQSGININIALLTGQPQSW